ncbi:pentatricopeptide repeat-containing protein At5g61370, mitochondrial [Magnolia sinica]|uniref:pentatricopeptide repeat-containing protein At5g61370, mitochondrial n=1 Tax=Magnolia sinica TaxID=86752 RepID=UPI0026594542|nr:pentatricopeptide repeat-containing protein At5g61370, mitochondrial [Magnolia sinica]
MLKLKFNRFLPLLTPHRMQFQCLLSHKYSTTTPTSSQDLQKLCEIVSGGVGNLDDLEASLEHSNLNITPEIVTLVIDYCKAQAPNRRLLRFFSWSRKIPNCDKLGDGTFNQVIQIFAEKKDLMAMDILISDLQKEHRSMDSKTFSCVVESLVKSGREDEALRLFKNLDKFNCSKDRISLSVIVHALCSKGHARMAEGVVWRHKNKIPIEPCIYDSLLHGWCIHGNVKEVRRIVDEMKLLGICPGLLSYNAFLRCICDRNVKFNPSALVPEATNLMMEMRTSGVHPTAISFNILLSCLSRTRRVKEAYQILQWMKERGCSPDWVSYYIVVRLFYLTGRFGRGNRLVDQMIGEGLIPKARFYHDLIGVLCGVEEVRCALEMFERMKKSCVGDYGPVYDMLIPKLCRGGEFDKGRHLWDEAVEKGITLQCSSDILDPAKTEVFKPKGRAEKGSLEDSRRVVKMQKKCITNVKRMSKKKASSA